MTSEFEIVQEPDLVWPYLQTVHTHSDAHRDQFGFLPYAAYQEQSEKGRLLVARDTTTHEYFGHLLFGGKHSNIKIFQIYVVAEKRGSGIARSLLSFLIRYAKKNRD